MADAAPGRAGQTRGGDPATSDDGPLRHPTRRDLIVAGGAAAATVWVAPSITGVSAAAAQSAVGTVVGVDQISDSFYTVDTSTGAWTLVGTTGVDNPLGLAFNPDDGVLYGCQNGTPDGTFTVDPVTGAWTLLGTAVPPEPQGLAHDSSTGTMYGSSGDSTYTVDLVTGAWTLLGSSAVPFGTNQMTYDSLNDVVYGVRQDGLYTVDRVTGAWTLFAAHGLGARTDGVVYDSVNDVLYGNGRPSAGATYSIDRATGAWVLIGATNTSGPRGMAFVL